MRYDINVGACESAGRRYAMPGSTDLPMIVCTNLETPTALNPLGMKGVGEAGTVGALSATMNAACNVLQAAGILHLDMPATPVRIWRALQEAASRSTA